MPKLIPPVVPAGTLARVAQPMVPVDAELLLRPWRAADAPTVVLAYTTADIQRWHFRRYDTIAEAEIWIAEGNDGWRSESQASWAILRRTDEEVVGRVAIYPNLADGYGEVSYWVLPSARGEGVATRAASAATGWAHDLGLHRVELEHSVHNAASGRVAERAGFMSEGIRREANLHADGWHDMHLYSHLSSGVAGQPSSRGGHSTS
jgi:RimJ/RimL family protein N-acetyltransferase